MLPQFDEEKNLSASIGHRVRESRIRRGLSQADLAERVGLLKQHVSSMEIGTRGITLKHVRDFARVLNVSTDYLLGLSDETMYVDHSIHEDDLGLSSEAKSRLVSWNIPASTTTEGRMGKLALNTVSNLLSCENSRDLFYLIGRYIQKPQLSEDDFSEKDAELKSNYFNGLDNVYCNGELLPREFEFAFSTSSVMKLAIENELEKACDELRPSMNSKKLYMLNLRKKYTPQHQEKDPGTD